MRRTHQQRLLPSRNSLRLRPRTSFRCVCIRLLCLIALACSVTRCTRSGETGVNPGDLAPDFSAKLLGGEEKKLSDYRGKLVLLNFWASWCGPCVSEMPALQRLHEQLKDRGFSVVAVGVDDEESTLDEFRRKFGLSFPVLAELGNASKRLYRTSGVPESFIIAPDGKLLIFQDPEGNSPVVRISGPRDWDAPNVVSRISSLLSKYEPAR